MKCPKCKTEYVCPCRSCKANGIASSWTGRPDGDLYYEKCPGCGFEQEINDWFEESMKQYEEAKKACPSCKGTGYIFCPDVSPPITVKCDNKNCIV
jgi:hypothetical protein